MIHLHVHTEYSILDSIIRPKELFKKAADLGHKALAITDHGTLSGLLQCELEAKKHGIKFIPGCEFYLSSSIASKEIYHLVVLAIDNQGYQNLLKLSSISYKEGYFYRKPRITHKLLAKHSEGLVVLSACIQGDIPSAILNKSSPNTLIGWYKNKFPDRFFLEVQQHGKNNIYLPRQSIVNEELLIASKKINIPCVLTCDCHFLEKGEHEIQDVARCIAYKQELSNMKYKGLPSTYYKSEEELLADLDSKEMIDALEMTETIGDMVDIHLNRTTVYQPKVSEEAHVVLQELAVKNLNSYLEENRERDVELYKERLKKELDILDKMDFNNYFLLIYDLINEAKRRKVSTGDGRGSVAGSLVAFVLSITGLDPIEHGLIFERFLNEGRTGLPVVKLGKEIVFKKSEYSDDRRKELEKVVRKNLVEKKVSLTNREIVLLRYEFDDLTDENIDYLYTLFLEKESNLPNETNCLTAFVLELTNDKPIERIGRDSFHLCDIDIDFNDQTRNELFDYCKEKYGSEMVGRVPTFSTLQPRSVLKGVGKVLECSQKVEDFIGILPEEARGGVGEFKITIDKLLELDTVQRALASDSQLKKVIEIALKLEGNIRHVSVNACGFIISSEPISNIVPTYRSSNYTVPLVQWSKDDVELAGLVKFDMLGLINLSIIANAVELIRRNDPGFDIPNGFEDKNVYRLIATGNTAGIFQLGSSGMQNFMQLLQPTDFNDLSAGLALYRPGPMDNDMHTAYAMRKNGKEEVSYLIDNEAFRNITKETYGLILYQEQMMQIAVEVAGFTLKEADDLRRAVGKKKMELMQEQQSKFVEGAVKIGSSRKESNDIWDVIVKFASYSFNKSHSASYSILSYQTAYLKAYYPLEFFAGWAQAAARANKLDKVLEATYDAINNGIEMLPPDILSSSSSFSVISGKIRAGFDSVKGLGIGFSHRIKAYKRNNWFDFSKFVEDTRADFKGSDYKYLINSGALDRYGYTRAGLRIFFDLLTAEKKMGKKKINVNQIGLFQQEKPEEDFYVPPLVNQAEDIEKEIEACGILYSIELPVRGHYIIISSKDHITRKKGERFKIITLYSEEGIQNYFIWPRTLKKYREEVFEPGNIITAKIQGEQIQGLLLANKKISRKIQYSDSLLAKLIKNAFTTQSIELHTIMYPNGKQNMWI